MSYTGEQRLTIWLKRIWMMNEHRMQRLRHVHSTADEAHVQRLWLEETYPGEFTSERLDAYEAWCRSALNDAGAAAQTAQQAE